MTAPFGSFAADSMFIIASWSIDVWIQLENNEICEVIFLILSDLILEYRTSHTMSQRQFALVCGLSNGYISMLEKNTNPNTGVSITPTIPALQKISKGLGISLNELFALVDDIPVDLLKSDLIEDKSIYYIRDESNDLDRQLILLLDELTHDQKLMLMVQLKTLIAQNQSN